MAKKFLLALCLLVGSLYIGGSRLAAQQDDPSRIRVNVVLVQLNVAVTDSKGNYVSGLQPDDFTIVEDAIPEKIATFEEGDEGPRRVLDTPAAARRITTPVIVNGATPPAAVTSAGITTEQPKSLAAQASGANVFILFDTSNYMYRGFVFAQDSITDFIRSLEGVGKVAFYSYSRDLSRATSLTSDRSQVLRGVRSTVAGDDAALYNSLLLTVKDAAQVTGKKAIVVFSNGPDNASLVPPEDVAELAQSTGTIIYMISTQLAEEQPANAAVFERMSKVSGGKAYFSRSWKDEREAFASIRNDLAHLYTLSYYPQTNANHGWRSIHVKLNGKAMQKYRIRTRDGYRVQQTRTLAINNPTAE